MPDDAGERLRRAQHPGHRRQAHPAHPQRDEHRRRVRGQRPGHRRARRAVQHAGGPRLPHPTARGCRTTSWPSLGHFGLSSICNVLAAIKTAKLLDLGPDDAVITVATDGAALYPSERAKTIARRLRRHRSGRSTPPRSSPSTSARPDTDAHDRLHTSGTAPASSTSATTRGSSSRARRSRCSRPGARRRSGAGCAATCRVWDELIADFNARGGGRRRERRDSDGRRRLPLPRSAAPRSTSPRPVPWRCPNATSDDRHHVLHIVRRPGPFAPADDPNPFLAFGAELAWQAFALRQRDDRDAAGALVRQVDARVAAVDGTGFRHDAVRPGRRAVRRRSGSPRRRRVGEGRDRRTSAGSHKARHLVSILLHLKAAELLGLGGRERRPGHRLVRQRRARGRHAGRGRSAGARGVRAAVGQLRRSSTRCTGCGPR